MKNKILVIDDEELIVKSLKKLLQKQGFVVSIAKSGQDALAKSYEEKFDLLIADIRMPGMNGVETIEEIHKNLNQKIPTIFITGYADEQIERKARILEPVAYIYKPFDIKEFVDKVEGILKEQKNG